MLSLFCPSPGLRGNQGSRRDRRCRWRGCHLPLLATRRAASGGKAPASLLLLKKGSSQHL